MNPNVLASYALLGRLRDHGVTHAVISPGSRSTPLAFVAYELFDATVVIDERDAGFIALGISESSGQPAVVITTSGSAPTHLFPSVVEAFHSNVGMIVITADRPHEVRGRGAPQTIDQFNMFGSATRYFYDARTPHEEDGVDYWEARADELFDVADGSRNVVGPAHLNMGMNEPLSPDGDENRYMKSLALVSCTKKCRLHRLSASAWLFLHKCTSTKPFCEPSMRLTKLSLRLAVTIIVMKPQYLNSRSRVAGQFLQIR